jgi:hypothetical protein
MWIKTEDSSSNKFILIIQFLILIIVLILIIQFLIIRYFILIMLPITGAVQNATQFPLCIRDRIWG